MKKMVTWVLLMSLGWSQGCWDLKEKSALEFDELSEKVTFSVKNALTCEPIANAYVNFNGQKLSTDAKGSFSVALDSLEDGQKLKVLIKADDYLSLLKNIRVEAGTIWDKKIVLSPKLDAKEIRLVLSWQRDPADLDLHLVGPSFHVSYQNMHSVDKKASLDRDARFGFGPEVITLNSIAPNEVYKVFVNRFSRKGAIDGKAHIELYVDGRFYKNIVLPKATTKNVEVLHISNEGVKIINKSVEVIN